MENPCLSAKLYGINVCHDCVHGNGEYGIRSIVRLNFRVQLSRKKVDLGRWTHTSPYQDSIPNDAQGLGRSDDD